VPIDLSTRLRALVRPALGHPRVMPATALALRARTVRPAWRFAARELARRPGLMLYRAPGAGGLLVGLRHGTGDVVTLGEVFHELDYVPPPAVAAVLPAAPRVLDLGANVGLFGAYALGRWPEATVVAYEPDPANAAVHERVVAANGLQDRWRVERAAAGAADGTARFASGEIALSRLADDGDLEVRVVDVLDEIAAADLLKVDIEGGEWPILADPRFAARPPRVVAMEYHATGAPGPDPRAEAERLLHGAGFQTAAIRRHAQGDGMLWAWRT
jgi:FkbM family methyltransferase